MPVTVQVVDHAANPWKAGKAATVEKLLESVDRSLYAKSKSVLRSSFTPQRLSEGHVSASANGLVWAAIHAYSGHHHLTVRPEDVWFAVLTQLSFYINAHAKQLRSFFVAHEGQKELRLLADGNVWQYNFGYLAAQMTNLMAKEIKDPELRTWVMPSFSTTTDDDIAVASILFMGAMQKYFSYGMMSMCGIPSVTVLGEVADWEDILGRLDKLEQLGDEPAEFAGLLRPILKNIILTFTQPTNPSVPIFWNSIANLRQMSGSSTYTGWIAAFCFWGEDGKRKISTHRRNPTPDWVARDMAETGEPRTPPHDLASYPSIESDDIPKGFASLPVQVDEVKCTFVAGSVGIQASASSAGDQHGDTAIQPVSGWWLLERESAGDVQARQDEIKALDAQIEDLDKQSKENRKRDGPLDMDLLNRSMAAYHRREELNAMG